MDGNFIKEWKSTSEVGRSGFVQQHISACCLGKLKHHKKYKWSFEKDILLTELNKEIKSYD